MQYKFDKFIVDTDNLSLLVGQQVVSTEQRMIRLLILLIEAFPAPCEQQFLLDNVWQRTVVSYWSLARLVSDTRRFFKQHGYPETVIETVHGSGFRLGATVSIQRIAVDAAVALPHQNKQRITLTTAGAGAVCLCLLAALAASQRLPVATQAVEVTAAPMLTIGEPATARGRLLWVDDHPDNNTAEIAYLLQQQLGVYTVTNTNEALTLLSLYRYDAVISDMGRHNDPLAGLKLLQQLRAEQNETPFFFYTIMLSDAKRTLLKEQGADGAAETSLELYQQLSAVFSDLKPVVLESE